MWALQICVSCMKHFVCFQEVLQFEFNMFYAFCIPMCNAKVLVASSSLLLSPWHFMNIWATVSCLGFGILVHPIMFQCQLNKLADVLRLQWLRFPLGMSSPPRMSTDWVDEWVDESILAGSVICIFLHIDKLAAKSYDYYPAGFPYTPSHQFGPRLLIRWWNRLYRS